MAISYQFLPWARRGLARAHRTPDAGGPLPARAQVKVGLTLQARQDGSGAPAVSGGIDLSLYGPGDVIGIDPRLVVRTDPRPTVTNFEPNYLAVVDFDPPDFPWMMTPAHADAAQRLRPWLALVVLRRETVALPRLSPGAPLPALSLTAAQVGSDLPDLRDAALWAHAQMLTTRPAADVAGLVGELRQAPERNISRLVCPRRLAPRTAYLACVVPAFEVGRLRGLGQPVAADAVLTPAWQHDAPGDLQLPVYYHWEFATGPVGDIETLARRIRTPDKYRDDTALLAQLDHIGELPVAVDGDHLLFNGDRPGQTIFEGALVSLDFAPAPPDDAVTLKLEAMLNSGQDLAAAGSPKPAKVPTLSPPLYGEHPARRHTVQGGQVASRWLDQLNLQPRYRLAAGWGAEVVRQNQEDFMQAAWEQVGEVLAAERAFSLSRLSRDVLRAIEQRHLAKLPDHRLLAVLAPARARLKLQPGESLYGRIDAATLPAELFDGAMRRFASPNRQTLRMALWRGREAGLANVSAQMQALVAVFANAASQVTAVDPNRFVPDGLMGSRSIDEIPLPADLNSQVDLFGYTGLAGSLSGNQLAGIRQQGDAARRLAAVAKPTPDKLGDVWHTGILTETHTLRIVELQRVAGRHLDAVEIDQLVKLASGPGAEGVLLSVTDAGVVSAQALTIDGRNGSVQLVGRAFTARGRGAPTATEAAEAAGPPVTGAASKAGSKGSLGAVPVRALRQYGNAAVFASLPGGVLGQNEQTVAIKVTSPGRFDAVVAAPTLPLQPVQPVRPIDPLQPVDPLQPGVLVQPVQPGLQVQPIRPTITLPPAEKSRVVIGRYVEAFNAYQAQAVDPMATLQVSIEPLNLAMAPATAQARGRIDPTHTVPARLASTLALGGQGMAWDAASGLSHPFLSTRLDTAFLAGIRYVVPRQWDRVMAFPHLAMPLARRLEVLAPEAFLPGVGVLPDDFIMAVKTNPRFVEALMVGANHEMGRELLWRGFPTDQRGTPFQHFWQRLDGRTDIDLIHTWQPQSPLGGQPGSAEMLVLLIRGQLLERFPNLGIYAYPRQPNDARPGAGSPANAEGKHEMNPALVKLPVLRGHLGSDITYVGFDPAITPTEDGMRGWFFVLEEHMTEPRFGFDEPDGPGQNSMSWLDVDWTEAGVAPGACFTAANLRAAPPAVGQAAWTNPHAAMAAQALMQRPFRGYYAGSKLVPPKGPA
ncbi:MAG: hypothetical protein JWQ88_325 [Rhodoferax sp.]|nr:hypothetical protein [Rhodoferax sp.]